MSEKRMPARADHDRDEKAGRTAAAARIREGVMNTLGPPDHLWVVTVRRLWAEFYRVNVFVGDDSTTARIAHSYFLAADESGEILDSSPTLCRVYGTPADCPPPKGA